MRIAIIDVVFIFLILIISIRGALRGLVEESMSMAALVLGVLTGFLLNKNAAALLRQRWFPEVKIIPEILAFLILFTVVFIAIKIVEFLLRDIVDRINLGTVDRFLGFLFGLLEGLVLVLFIIFGLSIQPLFDPVPILRGSFFFRITVPLLGFLRERVLTE